MTFTEMSQALQTTWVQNIRWKMPIVVISVLTVLLSVLFVIWESPPPSFLSYAQLSESQIKSFLGMDEIPGNAPAGAPANASSYSAPASAPTARTDSLGPASPVPQTKQRPVEAKNPDPTKTTHPNTTTVPEPTLNSTKVIEDDTQLVPDNTLVPSEAPTNTVSDVFVEEDSQLVDPSTFKEHPQPSSEEKKYLVPLLDFRVGTGNQLMEYKTAAVVARTLNRTLCLIPFFGGPSRHSGNLGDLQSTGLVMEGLYDIDVLSKFVKVAHMEECMQQCNRKLDVDWWLRRGLRIARPPDSQQWFNDTPKFSVDLTNQSQTWGSTADVANELGPRNDAHCAGLGGLFPGLRWRGVLIAASTYMEHSAQVKKAADLLQARGLLGTSDNNFVAVHWRFEESICSGHPLGLCFLRCIDGAVIANGRMSETWKTMVRENLTDHPTAARRFSGVAVRKEDISGAIYDRVVQWGAKDVYIATDGWLRGNQSADLVKWVVEDLRSKGMNVAGLWLIKGLPNFADGFMVSPANMGKLFGFHRTQKVSTHIIALVEQEICLRAAVFLGSGQSTWSLAVSDTRRGLRYKQELKESMPEFKQGKLSPEVQEQAIMEKILTIQFLPPPICTGTPFNSTMQRYEDEIPDGWLDYEACEVRLLKGNGTCHRLTA